MLLRATDLNTGPGTNVFARLVGFATARNVDTVFVGGQVRKWAGRLVGHDLTALHDFIDESLAHLFDARGLVPDEFADRGIPRAGKPGRLIGRSVTDPAYRPQFRHPVPSAAQTTDESRTCTSMPPTTSGGE